MIAWPIGKAHGPDRAHFEYDPTHFLVIEPDAPQHAFLREHGIRFIDTALTPATYQQTLSALFPEGKGFCVNLSVDTSSLDLLKHCRKMGVLLY